METPLVAIIVVTFNRLNMLKDCIESLRLQTYTNHKIIVINNGSTDSTSEWLNTQKDLIVIEQSNQGGAGGFYSGIKYACEHGFSHSWVMDDDVEADKNALAVLMEKTEFVKGFLCSHVLDISGNPCNVPKISTKKSQVSNELLWGEYIAHKLLRVELSSFVSLLFDNKLIYEVGLPYREYFIWGDDTEFTKRISNKYASYLAFESLVIHKRKIQCTLSIEKENEKNRIALYYYAYRNRLHAQGSVLIWLYSFRDFFKCIMKGKLYSSYIVIKGLLVGLFFNPKLKFPE